MDTRSSYATLSRATNVPATAESPQHQTRNIGKYQYIQGAGLEAPGVSVEETDNAESQTDGEVEVREDEVFEVLYGSKTESRARKYADATFLSPPQPYLHRRPNKTDLNERKEFNDQDTRLVRQAQPEPGHHNTVPSAQSRVNPPLNPSNVPSAAGNASKARKARPSPLALVPPPSRLGGLSSSDPSSPYSPSILSLYTSRLPPSPSPRSHSLPLYAFQPSDLPSPGGRSPSLSAPKSQSSYTSSPSINGSVSPATSTSSFHDQSFWCAMPTPPTPTAVFASKKDRIYKSIQTNELAGIAKRKSEANLRRA
jgi:hypothetical protein